MKLVVPDNSSCNNIYTNYNHSIAVLISTNCSIDDITHSTNVQLIIIPGAEVCHPNHDGVLQLEYLIEC